MRYSCLINITWRTLLKMRQLHLRKSHYFLQHGVDTVQVMRNREYLIKQHDEDSKKQKPTSQNPVLFGEQAKSSIENSSGSDLSSQNLGLVELSTFFSSTLCRFGLPVSFVVCTFRLDILIWNTDFMCGVTTGRLCKYKSLRMAAGATNNIMVGHSPPVKYPKCENRK